MSSTFERLSVEDLEAEVGAILPTKEVLSVPLLDLNADINLALDLAAPIDLAVAGNANVALPINAAVSANALSALSTAEAGGSQGVALDQFISGHAIAHGAQTSTIDQGGSSGTDASAATMPTEQTQPVATGSDVQPEAAQPAAETPTVDTAQPAGTDAQPAAETAQPVAETAQPTADGVAPADAAQPVAAATAQPAPTDAAQPVAAATAPQTEPAATPAAADTTQPPAAASTDGVSLDNGLLNVNVNVDLNSKLAAPITGAVALNANVAAPVNGSVAANVGTIGSQAVAVADQTALISQQLQDVTAEATTNQNADINQ